MSVLPASPGAARMPVSHRPVVHTVSVEKFPSLLSPRELRRLVGSSLQGFLHPGSFEDQLVTAIAVPSERAASPVLRQARERAAIEEQARLVERIRDVTLGDERLPGCWGTDAVGDHLRVRRVASGRAPASQCLEGVLDWLGRQPWPDDLASLPPEAVGAAAVVLAGPRSWRATFELLATRFRQPEEAVRPAMARVALASVLDGQFLPGFVGWLVPDPGKVASRHAPPEAFLPALVALQALTEQHQAAGEAHLLAAIVATVVRARLVKRAARHGADLPVQGWGVRRDEAAQAEAVRRVRDLPRRFVPLWAKGKAAPLEDGWGAPRQAAFERSLASWLGRPLTTGREILLDDGLALAAVFGMLGLTPSAHGQLMAVRTGPALADARTAVEAALLRPHPRRRPLVREGWGTEARVLLTSLREYRDPNRLLGTPYWATAFNFHRHAQRPLARQGRLGEAQRLRTALLRDDVRTRLEPWWLLPKGQEKSLSAVVAWMGRHVPGPTPHQIVLFLEKTWRELQSA